MRNCAHYWRRNITVSEAGNELRYEFNGKSFGNLGRLDFGQLHDEETKVYTITITNRTEYTIQGIDLVSNMPKNVYDASVPDRIAPKSKADMKIKIYGKPLYETKDLKQIRIGLDYVVVRRFE